jgi:hypothetical protein
MAGECEELIETRKLKLENSEEKIPTHSAREWGTQNRLIAQSVSTRL